jgi:hypothetical protein
MLSADKAEMGDWEQNEMHGRGPGCSRGPGFMVMIASSAPAYRHPEEL